MFIEGVHPVSRLKISNTGSYGVIRINPHDNAENLPEGYIEQTLGNASERSKRRFLYGEFSDENENALWKSSTMIDPFRVVDAPDDLERIVIGVDPAVTSSETSDHTGIVVCGKKTIDGQDHFFVLGDDSLIAPPERWSAVVSNCFNDWFAELVVAEINQGGDLVESTLRNTAPNLPVKKVRATRGKIVRAEPISVLYSQGRVHHVGLFPELENEMTSYTGDRTSEDSPDRLDALVWALTELSFGTSATTDQGELFFD
jgi:phage terminase large subunit-like protein